MQHKKITIKTFYLVQDTQQLSGAFGELYLQEVSAAAAD